MRTSDHGLQQLKQWEGFKPKMYKDAAGLPTIGVGHLLKKDELASSTITILGVPVKYADGLSEEQVTALLGQDLEPAENAVKSNVNATSSTRTSLMRSWRSHSTSEQMRLRRAPS